MQYSEFIPKFSEYKSLLEELDGMQVTLVKLLALDVQKIESNFNHQQPTKNKLLEKYNFRENRADAFMKIYNSSNVFITTKYLQFADRYGLLESVPEPTNKLLHRYKLTKRGQSFTNEDLIVFAEIDLSEMLLLMLDDIKESEESDGFNFDKLYPLFDSRVSLEFEESRVSNLLDRGLISKRFDNQEEVNWYRISKKGKKYLKMFQGLSDGKDLLEKVFLARNGIEKLKLFKYLSSMEAYKFEYFISRILKEMGYQDITVTDRGGDGGIDIKAKIKAGTSTINEIIQVKRWNSNIQRPTVDQLRGVLSVSEATRGSIFTISDFSRGCYESVRNDNSISLINGEQLLGLVFKYGIGVRSKSYNVYRFMPSHIDEQLKDIKIPKN